MKANIKVPAKKKLGVNYWGQRKERHWDSKKRQENYVWKAWSGVGRLCTIFPKDSNRLFLAELGYLAICMMHCGKTRKNLIGSCVIGTYD